MAKIIEFLVKEVYDWNIIEKTIRPKLDEYSAPLEMQNVICNRMKDVFIKYNIKFETNFQLPIPACATQEETKALNLTVSNAFSELGKKINDLMNIVLFDRLLIEIELYKLKTGI